VRSGEDSLRTCAVVNGVAREIIECRGRDEIIRPHSENTRIRVPPRKDWVDEP
jgi:hypothetical protein